MTPLAPETVLAAVMTMMRAAAGELNNYGAALAVRGVAFVIDQFPTNAAGGCRWRGEAGSFAKIISIAIGLNRYDL